METKENTGLGGGLARGISRWDLLAICINTVIGAGIFGLPSKVYKEVGTYSILVFVLCAAIVALFVLCFAEVASRFESTGGMYLYARESFGPVAGFQVGWLYWIVRMTSFAANCNLMLAYLTLFVPGANVGFARELLILCIVAFLVGVNVLGVRQSAMLTNVFTIGKLAPLILLAVVGAFFVEPANFTFGDLPGYSSVTTSVVLLIYAFVGFEATVIPAGESKDPKRDMPFALIGALIVIAVLFIAIQVVAVGTVPGLASSERPLADAAGSFLGPIGASLIGVGAVVSILGNLNGGLLAGSRIPFAMGERGEVPGALARVSEKFKTPVVSLVLTGLVTAILTLKSDFVGALTVAVITRLLVYAVTCASLPVFRFRKSAPEAGFKAPAGIVLSFMSLAVVAWLISNVDLMKEGRGMVGAIVAGLVIYFGFKVVSGARRSWASE